jgi:hypothetical protein
VKTIGVTGSWEPSKLKRELLFFDEIVVTDPYTNKGVVRLFDYSMSPAARNDGQQELYERLSNESANLDFLLKKGCLVDSSDYGFDFSVDASQRSIGLVDCELGDLYQEIIDDACNFRNRSHEEWVGALARFIKAREVFGDYFTVFVAEQLRHKNLNAVSLSKRFHENSNSSLDDGMAEKYLSLSQVVLDKIPIPSEAVSFERILDFRGDEEAKGYLAGLRNWMNRASKLDKTSLELSEELEWLKYKHAERLAKHRIDTQYSVLSSIFIGTCEIAEKVIKLQWGGAAKTAISLVGQRQKTLGFDIDPEAGELNFLIQAEEAFGRK